jgi:hypothetical protein
VLVKRALTALVAVLALAGCGASTTDHHASKPKTSATTSLYEQSFQDGESYGSTADAVPSSTSGQIQANCEVLELENIPAGDISSAWLAGCEAAAKSG